MIELVSGSVEHVGAMHEIECESFSSPWTDVSIKHEILRKESVCVVALENDGENKTVVGHAYMRQIFDEGRINNVAVRKSHRRRGVGSLLVEGLIAAAPEREISALTLEVREGNVAAISLYEKHGFKAEGIRKNYYSNPTENGIVMWKYL
jgi:ribosomal-protein-alanine N-acetyltransferase